MILPFTGWVSRPCLDKKAGMGGPFIYRLFSINISSPSYSVKLGEAIVAAGNGNEEARSE